MATEDTLNTEIEYYDTQKAALLVQHEGQYALVSGTHLLGTYTAEEEAYAAGLKLVGNKPFLIRQIRKDEPHLQAPVLFVGLNLGSITQ